MWIVYATKGVWKTGSGSKRKFSKKEDALEELSVLRTYESGGGWKMKKSTATKMKSWAKSGRFQVAVSNTGRYWWRQAYGNKWGKNWKSISKKDAQTRFFNKYSSVIHKYKSKGGMIYIID